MSELGMDTGVEATKYGKEGRSNNAKSRVWFNAEHCSLFEIPNPRSAVNPRGLPSNRKSPSWPSTSEIFHSTESIRHFLHSTANAHAFCGACAVFTPALSQGFNLHYGNIAWLKRLLSRAVKPW
jgi:hypothetical protein